MSSGIYNKYTGYHNRRSIRLQGHDYSQPGYYFITFCIHDRKQRLFGNIVDGKMVLNDLGNIAYNQFGFLLSRFSNMLPDEFQIMPNHIHAVIPIVGATLAVAPHNPEDYNPTKEIFIHPFGIETVAGASLAVAPATPENYKPIKGKIIHPFGIETGAGASPAPTTETPTTETTAGNRKTITISDIIGAYKSLVANHCLTIYKSKNTHMGKLWQRNYYDHIIRDKNSLYRIRKYIRENPLNWAHDKEKHIDREIDEFKMVENQD